VRNRQIAFLASPDIELNTELMNFSCVEISPTEALSEIFFDIAAGAVDVMANEPQKRSECWEVSLNADRQNSPLAISTRSIQIDRAGSLSCLAFKPGIREINTSLAIIVR
jgi:hypothetical protein